MTVVNQTGILSLFEPRVLLFKNVMVLYIYLFCLSITWNMGLGEVKDNVDKRWGEGSWAMDPLRLISVLAEYISLITYFHKPIWTNCQRLSNERNQALNSEALYVPHGSKYAKKKKRGNDCSGHLPDTKKKVLFKHPYHDVYVRDLPNSRNNTGYITVGLAWATWSITWVKNITNNTIQAHPRSLSSLIRLVILRDCG